jgi:CheY-like chemotaxis protein/GAF domain-containing protein
MSRNTSMDETAAPVQDRAIGPERSFRSEAAIGAPDAARGVDERRCRELLQALPVAAYTTDATGTIVQFNDAAVALWGRAPERGRRWCGATSMASPDGATIAPEHCPLAVTLRERRSQSRVPIVIGRPDGSLRHVLAHPQLLYGDGGAIVGAVEVLVSISDQARAESELARAQEAAARHTTELARLHELARIRVTAPPSPREALEHVVRILVDLHGADFGLLSLFDPEGGSLREAASVGLDANALALVGNIAPLRGVGACGTSFTERRRVIVPDVDDDPAFECLRDTARSIGFRAVHSTPVFSRDGEILGVLSVHFRRPRTPSPREVAFADISARAAADTVASIRERHGVQESARRKDEFLATLAHELRNPLAAMRYSLDVLGSEATESAAEAARAALDRQLSQIVRLVDDLLDVGRIASGRIELRRELVDLTLVLRNAVDGAPWVDPAEPARALPPAPVFVDGDPIRLAQAFGSLLAGTEGAFVGAHADVALTVEDGTAVTRVRLHDAPSATTADVLRTVQRPHGGPGVGLGVPRRLIELHGGTITTLAEEPHALEFEVRLPLSAGRHPFAEDGATTPPSPRPRRLRVVVADDNEDAAAALEVLLGLMGHEVHVAHDGVEAIELADRVKPDAIVLDVGMPRLSGLDACREIRSHAWSGDAVIVALTGWGQAEDMRRSFDAGFDHHLVKPCDRASLTALLEQGRR